MKLFRFFSKRELQKELAIYKEMILKKLDEQDLNSALEKACSALTLIKEHHDKFELIEDLIAFEVISNNVSAELKRRREKYVNRFNKFLKITVDETNIEKLMKLMASLKGEVDKYVDQYNINEISSAINRYFEFIKRLYMIFGSYRTINFFEASETLFRFMNDLKFEHFPNLEGLIKIIYQNLVVNKLNSLSQNREKISLSELADALTIYEEDLEKLIKDIMNIPDNPIKVYTTTTREIIFRKI